MTRRSIWTWALLTVAATSGALNVIVAIYTLAPGLVARKDLVQDWLLARAVVNGLDPYTPLPILADRFLGSGHVAMLPQPSPHPPPVILMVWPLGGLDFAPAAAVWLAFELMLIAIAARALLRDAGVRSDPAATALATLVACAWEPFAEELGFGQLGAPLLLCTTLAVLALKARRDIVGGAWLGAAIALKLLGWPLLLGLLLARRWRAGGTTIAVTATLIAATLPVVGWAGLARYVTHVAPLGATLYRANEFNLAPYSLGWRLFSGTGSANLVGITAAPLFDAPAIASFAAPAFALAWVAVALWATRKLEDARRWSALLAASTVAGPIAWAHYLLPLVVGLHAAWCLGSRRWLVVAAILCSVPRSWRHAAAVAFAEPGTLSVPFAATAFSLLPLLGVAAWMVGITRPEPTSRSGPNAAASL